MKYNLYIPNSDIKDKWERYAKKENRSLAQFIRLAVEDRIRKIDQEETR